MQQNLINIAKSTKLSSLFFRQQKNAHSTKLKVKKIVCSCVVPKWENLTEMPKKISKGSKCTARANYLFLKRLNGINLA